MSIPYFKEEQRFNQWWKWLIIIISFLASFFPFYNSYVLGYESADSSELIATPIIILIMAVIIFVYARARLELRVDKFSIKYRFFPFVFSWKRIAKEELESAEVVKFNPILEYGGWGYRIRPKGRALTVKGKMGLKLKLRGKKRSLMIGTQKPEALRVAINKLMNSASEEY